MKQNNWYKDAFGPDYIERYPHRNLDLARKEVPFIISSCQMEKGDLILDVGCGQGRHSLLIAERGFHVIGLDLSQDLLNIANKANIEADFQIPFIRGDMRKLPFQAAFKSVISLFTSFGYFADDNDNQQVLHEMVRVLVPHGRLLLDLPNKSQVVKTLEPVTEDELPTGKLVQERWLTDNQERVEKRIIYTGENRQQTYFESVRLYELEEIRSMLKTAGLKFLSVHGDFTGSDYSVLSDRMILLGER